MASLKVRPLTIVAPHNITVRVDDVGDSLPRPEAAIGTGGFQLLQVVQKWTLVVVKLYLNV